MSEKKATRVGYGEALVELGAENEKIVVLDADPAQCPRLSKSGVPSSVSRRFNVWLSEG